MKVGDLVFWEGAGLIAFALGHPQTAVSGIVVETDPASGQAPCRAAVALVNGGVEWFSVHALEVVDEGR